MERQASDLYQPPHGRDDTKKNASVEKDKDKTTHHLLLPCLFSVFIRAGPD
jgi:hypothetical protein